MDLINALLRQVSQEKPQMRSARPSDPGVIYNPREAERQAYQEAVQSGDILGAPIPGANPEVSTLADAMIGVLMGGGALSGMGLTFGGNVNKNAPSGRVYHGTRSKKPLRNRPFIHVGTGGQASDRLSGTGRNRNQRIEMFEFNPKKTARIPDLGGGMDFVGNLVRALRRGGYITKAEESKVMERGSRAMLSRILRKKGYDAIEYKNKAEGPGTSYSVIDISKLEPPKHFPEQDLNLGVVHPYGRPTPERIRNIKRHLRDSPRQSPMNLHRILQDTLRSRRFARSE
jgi:hypothetical protein